MAAWFIKLMEEESVVKRDVSASCDVISVSSAPRYIRAIFEGSVASSLVSGPDAVAFSQLSDG